MFATSEQSVSAKDIALGVVGDNYNPGDEGYHDPQQVNWGFSEVAVSRFLSLMPGGTVEAWASWFEQECHMDEYDELGQNWRELLTCAEDRLADVVVLKKSGSLYLWDGWHRMAAAIIRGLDTLPALVGFPD
jgi:hypothetical protein